MSSILRLLLSHVDFSPKLIFHLSWKWVTNYEIAINWIFFDFLENRRSNCVKEVERLKQNRETRRYDF